MNPHHKAVWILLKKTKVNTVQCSTDRIQYRLVPCLLQLYTLTSPQLECITWFITEMEVKLPTEWREPSADIVMGLLLKPKQCHAEAFWKKINSVLLGMFLHSSVHVETTNTGQNSTALTVKGNARNSLLTALITRRMGTVARVLFTNLRGRDLTLPPAKSPKSRQPFLPTSTYQHN